MTSLQRGFCSSVSGADEEARNSPQRRRVRRGKNSYGALREPEEIVRSHTVRSPLPVAGDAEVRINPTRRFLNDLTALNVLNGLNRGFLASQRRHDFAGEKLERNLAGLTGNPRDREAAHEMLGAQLAAKADDFLNAGYRIA